MEPLTIRKEIVIDAPVERVWPYVGTQEGYRRWSCTVAEVHDVILEERAGGRYEERITVRGEEHHLLGEVLTHDPPHRLVLSFQSRRYDGTLRPPRTITITLSEQAGRTRVTVEETGFERLADEERERIFKSNEVGWTAAMEDLHALLAREVAGGQAPVTIRREIVIEASIEHVWPFVGTQAGWLKVLQSEHPDKRVHTLILEGRVGGRFESRGVFEGKPFRIVGAVLAYEPPRRLVLTWREEMDDGSLWPADTIVEETLTEEGGRTRITVVHSGFERLPLAYRERVFKSYVTGWERGMTARRALAEQQIMRS